MVRLINKFISQFGRYSGKFSFFRLATALMLCSALIGCGHFQSGKDPNPGPLTTAIDFYRGPLNHLNAVRAGTCPMYPGCSDYCRQAIEKHGPLIGWIMTCDRLLRCGRDELDTSPRILANGQPKCYDPLARNDWWWFTPDRPDPLKSYRKWQISID